MCISQNTGKEVYMGRINWESLRVPMHMMAGWRSDGITQWVSMESIWNCEGGLQKEVDTAGGKRYHTSNGFAL